MRWHGAKGWLLVVCEIDLKVGGKWRFEYRGPDGASMGDGLYRETVPPDRLVQTPQPD